MPPCGGSVCSWLGSGACSGGWPFSLGPVVAGGSVEGSVADGSVVLGVSSAGLCDCSVWPSSNVVAVVAFSVSIVTKH